MSSFAGKRREGGREGGHGNWAKRTYAEFRRLMEIYYGYSLDLLPAPHSVSLTHPPSSAGGCSCARKRLSRWPVMAKFHFCPMIPLLREEFLRDKNRTGGRITCRADQFLIEWKHEYRIEIVFFLITIRLILRLIGRLSKFGFRTFFAFAFHPRNGKLKN